jgi:hypothetical protein
MQQVRTMENLPTVKVSLSFGGGGGGSYSPGVDFEVGHGAQVLRRFTVDPAAVGIPPGFDPAGYRGDEPEFSLAEEVTAQLAGAGLRDDAGGTLWLQLASPIGYLAALPWEQMLWPVFPGWPIFRIPDFTLVPERGAGPVDMVVCISEPSTEPQRAAPMLLAELLGTSVTDGPFDITVHVLADLPTYRLLSDRPELASRVVLHDPRHAAGGSDGGAPDGGESPASDPWLSWLLREMQGRPVEAVHFFAHGFVSGGQPAIAMAESPTTHDERLWARFISPGQLAACLTQLGAWSVGFSSPPGNFSPLGLRQFADSAARLRPGPVIYHSGSPDATSAGWAYASVFRGRGFYLDPGSFMYVHPRTLGVQAERGYAETLVEQTLGPSGERELAPWATTTRRFLEQSTAQIFRDQDGPASAEQQAVGEGVRSALEFVNQVISRHGDQRR